MKNVREICRPCIAGIYFVSSLYHGRKRLGKSMSFFGLPQKILFFARIAGTFKAEMKIGTPDKSKVMKGIRHEKPLRRPGDGFPDHHRRFSGIRADGSSHARHRRTVVRIL
jgi:hypothetical protein